MVVAVILLYQQGKIADIVWGVISGTVLGIVAAATFTCFLLLGDLFPQILWQMLFAGKKTSGSFVLLWPLFAVGCWTLLGVVLGIVLVILGPLGKTILNPVQESAAWLFRLCGLRGLANFCAVE